MIINAKNVNYREHGELLEIKSLFKVENISVNSVVFFKCIFRVKLPVTC